MAYIFDSNIFITSKNSMPMDLWPTFWSKVAELIKNGDVFSSIKVKEEINRGKDELVDWIKNNAPKSFFIDIDNDILKKYTDTQIWANSNPNFSTAAKHTFADVADAYLVATAAATGFTLVTFETSDPLCKKRVKIPDACIAVGAKYCDLNTVFRELGVKI